ncbi:M1 family metallopeptidase [Thermocrispum municipale]|uniref:M1 family metallopeptidase n=1 Tax=Thermocrispum municipale TaxID=37926 RepID=UPI0004060288|nr:M1 family metallopeptidase [Thermocrispum municipale]
MSLRKRAGFTTAATGLTVLLLTSTASAAPGPGSPGVGDPYYPLDGNGGYDVSHYDVRVSYQPESDRLSGTTTILAKATQDLTTFNLDFLLNVDSVRVNNRPAKFSTDGGELTVDPAQDLHKGSRMLVVVKYSDTPNKYELYGYNAWKQTATGALAVDQPHMAPWWFPSNNHPTDKATYDISVAAPEGLEVISNGTLVGTSQQIDGMVRWHWRSKQPQATYLAFMAVEDYDVSEELAPNGLYYLNAYAKDLQNPDAARASVDRTPEVTEFLETKFGKYPFEALGGVVTTGLGFALETQTRPVYDDGFFARGANTYVVAHEQAHQWYGDSVSLGSWDEIWLNEGFAAYAEWLWSEEQGEGTAAEIAQFYYDSYAADDPFWDVLPGDPGAENQFHDAVYDRGAMTVHALRTAMGDKAFFKLLKQWPKKKRNDVGTTPELIKLAEKLSGKQLDEVFQTWLYTAGKPATSPNGDAAVRAAKAEAPKSVAKIDRTHKLLHQRELAHK